MRNTNILAVIWIVTSFLFGVFAPVEDAVAGLAKRRQPIVRDATGKLVGAVVQFGGTSARVFLKVSGNLIFATVRRDGFATNGRSVLFESVDCSGQPFFQDPGTPPQLQLLWNDFPPNQTVYIAPPSASPLTRTFESRMVGLGQCYNISPLTTESVPAEKTNIELATEFEAPFRLR
jgi:hypothetical protein